jgi:hypothetical protein
VGKRTGGLARLKVKHRMRNAQTLAQVDTEQTQGRGQDEIHPLSACLGLFQDRLDTRPKYTVHLADECKRACPAGKKFLARNGFDDLCRVHQQGMEGNSGFCDQLLVTHAGEHTHGDALTYQSLPQSQARLNISTRPPGENHHRWLTHPDEPFREKRSRVRRVTVPELPPLWARWRAVLFASKARSGSRAGRCVSWS